MNSMYNFNLYRKGMPQNEDILARVDNYIVEIAESGLMGRMDDTFLLLFGEVSDGKLLMNRTTSKYQFQTEGLVPNDGFDTEAPTIHSNYSFDQKTVTRRSADGRSQLSRSEMKYEDMSDFWKQKFKGQLLDAISRFFYQASQSGADILNRGWEVSYTDAFGMTVTNRDMEGSQPLFSAVHKIGASTPNAYRQCNVCIEKDNAGNIFINPEFSAEAVMDTYQYANMVRNFSGVPFKGSRNLNTLILSDKNARELLINTLTTHEINSANNNINIFPIIMSGMRDALTWHLLLADGQGNLVNPVSGKSYEDYWYLVDLAKVKENLHYEFLEYPVIKEETQTGNSESRAWYARAEWRIWHSGYDYVFGSNATNTPAPADFPKI